MGNRRSGNQKPSRVTAPRDPSGAFEDGPELEPKKSLWHWALLSGKVGLGLALIVSAVASLAWGVHRYAQTTPRFAIVKIEIEGTRRLARDDVKAAAGIEQGDNLFALDVEKAEKSLLESPWISRARVIRQLPGTITLEIAERDAAALAVIGGKTFLVARDGVPFKEMGGGDPHDLPVITGISLAALKADRAAEEARLAEALALLRQYEKLPISPRYPAQEAHLKASGHVVLTVGAQGSALHLGSAPWKKKLLRAERVLQKTARAGGTPAVVFLDNQAHPERVVVRVR